VQSDNLWVEIGTRSSFSRVAHLPYFNHRLYLVEILLFHSVWDDRESLLEDLPLVFLVLQFLYYLLSLLALCYED